MEKTPKEMLKAYVDSQKFNSTTEIMEAMSAPMIKCKKTPRKKCRFVAEDKEKR